MRDMETTTNKEMYLPYKIRQTIVRDGLYSVDVIAECSTLDSAKLTAYQSHNGNPTTYIYNVLTEEVWQNKQGIWTSIGWGI